MVAGIKNGQQCPICRVPSGERENLADRSHPLRDHNFMREQIHKQQINPREYPPTHSDWVQPWDNFAWEHDLVNIHNGMMIDKLHQLYKGIVKYTIQWVQEAIEEWTKQDKNKTGAPKRWKKGQIRDITKCSYVEQLDHRFKQIPAYTGLKIFNNAPFSEIKQWTGNEQKAIIKQLSPVLAPILTEKHPEAMQFVRAVVDLVMLAEYRTHDEDTLGYLDQAISRIDNLKEYFRNLRPKDKHTGEGQFNFPKFHVLVHYTDFIKNFGTLDGFDSATPETGHKDQVKEPYSRTNKQDDFLVQMARHSLRRINWLAMEGILFHTNTIQKPEIEKQQERQLNTFSRPKDLRHWTMTLRERGYQELHTWKDTQHWRPAAAIARHLGQPDFIDALAVFVREMRRIMDGEYIPKPGHHNDLNAQKCGISYLREPNPNWVESYPISLHSSMGCWIKTGKDPEDVQVTTKQLIRCKEQWHGKSKARRDFLWVQEYDGDFNISPVDGKTLGQLQAIVTIRDIHRKNDRAECREYHGCLLTTLKPTHNGQPNSINGMLTYKAVPLQSSTTPRKLGPLRFYNASMVLRAAHVVPAELIASNKFLLNPYIDWGEYTEIYTLQWEAETMEAAKKVAAEQIQRRQDAKRINRGQTNSKDSEIAKESRRKRRQGHGRARDMDETSM